MAGVRATTGLFSIFTLLCLVCLSSSLTCKDNLEKAKEQYQTTQKLLEELKVFNVPAMDTAKHQAGLSLSVMESLEASMKANEDEFPDDYQQFVQGMKDYVEISKNIVDEEHEKLRAAIEKGEKAQESLRKLITLCEEQHAEL